MGVAYGFMFCAIPFVFFLLCVWFQVAGYFELKRDIADIHKGKIMFVGQPEGEPMAQDMNTLMWYDL